MNNSSRYRYQWIAFGAGLLLSLMILLNGELAKLLNPISASTVVHATGTMAGAILLWIFPRLRRRSSRTSPSPKLKISWHYLAGIPGAITVIFASITINSSLGVAGTVGVMLLGQILFALAVDIFGWFGFPKRPPNLYGYLELLCVLSGCYLLIFS